MSDSKGVILSRRVTSFGVMLPVGSDFGEGGKLQFGSCASVKHGSEGELKPEQTLEVGGNSKLQEDSKGLGSPSPIDHEEAIQQLQAELQVVGSDLKQKGNKHLELAEEC